jgi:redox-sensitive bicupin YhaK (pirin superfamily)
MLKPFVFLNYVDAGRDPAEPLRSIPTHPHSGIATLTFFIEGSVALADSTGRNGVVEAGSIEWLYAGSGVWHTGAQRPGRLRSYQLWLALPQDQETAPAESRHLPAAEVPRDGPVRVLLGSYGKATSPIAPPVPVSYFAVDLADGESWSYRPAAGDQIVWLAVAEGSLCASGALLRDEVAVFEETDGFIDVTAQGRTSFVFGAAARHPYDLVLGAHMATTNSARTNSVHTSVEALLAATTEIERIGADLSVATPL